MFSCSDSSGSQMSSCNLKLRPNLDGSELCCQVREGQLALNFQSVAHTNQEAESMEAPRSSSPSTPSPPQPISRTPSPSGVVSATSKHNPFSIDYILSTSAAAAAAAAKHNQHQLLGGQQDALDKLNLMNQQRAQLMAAAAAAAAATQANLTLNQSQNSSQRTQAIQQPQVKIGQQSHPNFFYFMACMLFQQQQQQQQQQHHQQQQLRHQQIARQQQAANMAAVNQQLTRQPVDLATGQMDSLAILARLTANAPTSIQLPELISGTGKQARLLANQTIRNQPYPLQIDQGTNPYHSSGALHRQSVGTSNRPQPSQNPLPPPRLSGLELLNHQHNSLASVGQENSMNNKFVPLDSNVSCLSSRHLHQNHKQAQQHHLPASNNGLATNPDKLDNLKPAHSYIGLIGMCILSSPEKRMVLNDIYQFILDNYPYYRNRGSGWRNSVRHNLSLNECFQKAGRAANGKGHYWTIHPANMEDFMLGDFRRRRAQRKVRRWNNMDVPSDESEDESMEDATKPPLPEHFKRSLEMHRQLELSYQKSAAEATTAAFVAAAVGGGQPVHGALAAPSSASPCSPLFRKQELP